MKYPHHQVTFIASLKHIWKMAQLVPLGSSQLILAGSCSMVVDGVDMITAGADEDEDEVADLVG